ncbi:hypothetical protein BC7_00043 [Bacillus phage BC-7]|nr:hypothetical protein BC7_00043 [Bacillus phage BC-7]
MKHTRNRQIAKLHGNESHAYLWREECGTDMISDMRYWDRFKYKPTLDLSFMWIRCQYKKSYPMGNYYCFKGEYYAARKVK